jgi:hypothetical protein
MNTAEQGKDGLSRSQPPARQLARSLINPHGVGQAGSRTPAHVAAAACDRLYQDLSRWVGSDGCHALFTRALAHARTNYALLGKIQLRARSEPYLEGVAATIVEYGDPATADALESMLVGLIDLLGRLIGDDMATKLIERSLAASEHGDATYDGRREEA